MADKVVPGVLDDIKMQLHTLDSKISLIAQKIKMIEKNEEVIGRTIVLHNDKLRKIEEKGAGGASSSPAAQGAGVSGGDLDSLKKELDELKAKIDSCALKDEVRELKYVLDTINPLEYATIDQVKELLNERLGKRE